MAMKQHPRRKPSTPGQKPRVKKAAASADTRWQTCSICHTIPDHSWALWKGGEQQNNNLPPAMNQLLHVGAPFYNTEMSQSNYCLMQCPACGTYYAWDFEYEYLVNGSEDEINLTRLSQTEGEKQAQRNLKAIKAHNAWFMEQVPRQMEALRQAPREPDRLQKAANFFFSEGAEKGCDLAFALPDLLQAYSRMGGQSDAAGTLHTTLFVYGRQSWKNLQTLRLELHHQSMDNDPAFVSLLSSCEKTLRADCRICNSLPEYISARLETEELPAASKELINLGPHFDQCPICGAYYFWNWDTFPFVSGASDEQRLYRLSSDQAELLEPLFEALPKYGEEMAFYVGELGNNLVLALLCAFADRDEMVRALAFRCLERFISAQPEHARVVLDLIRKHEQDPPTPRTTIDPISPQLQELVRGCEKVLAE